MWLYLLEVGSSDVKNIAKHFGYPRSSVYDSLEILKENGLVVEREESNIKVFQADDPNNLERLLSEKIDILNKNKNEVSKFLSSVKVPKQVQPRIRFYSGIDGLKNILRGAVWQKNTCIYSMWPSVDLIELLGHEYFSYFNRQRIRQNISIKSIWLCDSIEQLEEYPFVGVGKRHLREVKIAPKNMNWKTAHLIHGDTVSFLSSGGELFGFTIQSKDFAELMKSQFDAVWQLSKPVASFPPKDDFLSTI